MSQALKAGHCRLPDDKLSTKMWTCEVDQLYTHVLSSLLADPNWSFCASLTPADVRVLDYAKARLGLPGFLRAPWATKGGSAVSTLFAFVKIQVLQK